jgi:signal transduction histidine kinase
MPRSTGGRSEGCSACTALIADNLVRKLLERQLKRHFGSTRALSSDMSERLRALDGGDEAEPRAARVDPFFEMSKEPLLVTTPAGCIEAANPAWEAAVGRPASACHAQPLAGFIHPQDGEALRSALQSLPSGATAKVTLRLASKKGAARPFQVSIRAEGGKRYLAFEDIGEPAAQAVQPLHEERLRAVAQLAAGVAHEINTPLQYMGDSTHFLQDAFADLARLLDEHRRAVSSGEATADECRSRLHARAEELELDELLAQIPKGLQRLLDGVQQVSGIVATLKGFSRSEQQKKTLSDLNEALRSALALARPGIDSVAELETRFGDLPPVLCHTAEMGQAFYNVLVNAAQAIAQQRGPRGRVWVATRAERGDAVVEIGDTGCGIAPAIAGRVYDLFFTTHPPGHGAGQGLSLARFIVVNKHGGSIDFQTEPGQGTRFFIRLPLSTEIVGEQAA